MILSINSNSRGEVHDGDAGEGGIARDILPRASSSRHGGHIRARPEAADARLKARATKIIQGIRITRDDSRRGRREAEEKEEEERGQEGEDRSAPVPAAMLSPRSHSFFIDNNDNIINLKKSCDKKKGH